MMVFLIKIGETWKLEDFYFSGSSVNYDADDMFMYSNLHELFVA